MWKFLKLTIFFGLVLCQTDYVPLNYEEVTKPTLQGFGAYASCEEGERQGRYLCVPYYRCDGDTNTIIPEENISEKTQEDYSLLIDIRLGEAKLCTESVAVCCKKQDPSETSPPPVKPTKPPVPPIVTVPTPELSFCGIRNENGIDFKITGNTNEAEYGEFPWMVAILNSNYNHLIDPTLAICGGSLIAPTVVLTGAHCVHNLTANDIKIRAGEWDTQTTKERYPYQERTVLRIIKHDNFNDRILLNNVALLVLEKPVKIAKHIGTICLPEQNEVIISDECYATGWGKNLFGRQGEYQVILKKIDLPIVPHQKCEKELQKTRLGGHFKLDESFLCAGGIPGKDTCTGDGGSPLVCPDPKNPRRYVQAGIVAWGIGCGSEVPGVYADVSKFRNWIDRQMKLLSLNTDSYKN